MAQRVKEEELQRLKCQIIEWNENRLDLFELSQPNESSEFHGVMRFFFQDEGAKVATKCIRVSSTATTGDVLETLIEKFRPDMRMLSMPRYSLYEVHVNGEERKLQVEERPLYVQLNWGKDDREGRFLLKNENAQTVPLQSGVYSENDQSMAQSPEGSGFKRKLSKREKKEKKKLDKEAKLRGKENETPQTKNGVAQKLYNELPETSFTRSISNPEAVMKRRRQMKLEKKLQQFKSRDGGPDTGGTLKIYGDSVKPDVPYKTLLLSTGDTVAYVVRETLEKYGLEKEDASNYCLVQVIVPPSGHEYHGGSSRSEEFILNDDDCPLAILMQHPPSQGTIMFQLRRRTEMPKKKKKRSSSGSRAEHGVPPDQRPPGPDRLPFLVELNPDGSEAYQRGKVVLPLNMTEVGSEQCMNGHYLQLYGPDVLPKHCVLAHMEGIVTATPASQDADTYVNNQRIYETTVLQHGALLRFGKRHMFRFYDPGVLESGGQRPLSTEVPKRLGPPQDVRIGQSSTDISNFETTFDVDGHIETVTREEKPPLSPGPEDLLPAMLEFREEGEDAFLAAVISEVNGAAVQFKLAPTYTLYMAIRYRIARVSHPNLRMAERSHWIASLVSKIANMVHQTIQESEDSPGALSFWMANASELLHFVKHDRHLQGAPHMMEAQDSLAEAVQLAFLHLVDCLQEELSNAMPAFLEESLRDLDADDDELPANVYGTDKPTLGDVLQVLSSAMSLLRRCRVNAALTIQLFSQLFHFINMWLFNTLVLEPRLGQCTRQWGHRWKRRLGRIEVWAEKQGLELAADCHLARIIQAAHLLEAPKSSADDIASISSACFKLNSLQLRALLENYVPGVGEPRIPQELIESVVGVAESTADELTRSDGRQIRLEEEPDLQLPFLLPEDGYSCDIIRSVPSGLADFLDPLCKTGICRFVVRAGVSGLWTVYFIDKGSQDNLSGGVREDMSPPKQQPEIINVTFNKVNGSMGLSIVAAKGEGQKDRGIYVKSVVAGGGAAKDGRLQAGDQLLEVDGRSLTGLTQEKAAEYMTRTGQTVTLKVAKQGAIYHGLATLLSQPSPDMQRAASSQKVRPHSDEMSRYPGHPDNYLQHPQGPDARQRAINQQMAARSSPSLTGSQASDRTRPVDHHHQPPNAYGQQDPNQMALRSKSTSNLDSPLSSQPHDYRQAASLSTLPRSHPQQPGSDHPDRSLSQPDFNASMTKTNYKNYPQGRYDPNDAAPRSPQIPAQPTYVNQSEIRQQHVAYSKHGASPPRQGTLEGRTAKSLSSLNHEEMQQRRTQQRPRAHELEQQGQMGASYYKGAPRREGYDSQPKPVKAVTLQKPPGPEEGRSPTHNGFYEARPVRAPDMQRPSYQQRVADMSRPPHAGSPPRIAGGPPQQGRYTNSEGGTLRSRPEFQRDKQSPLTRLEKYDQTNQSPDLPPPPDMSPDLPPPSEGLPAYSDDLPPPPPNLSGDTALQDQWRRGPGGSEFQQQRNAPDFRLDHQSKPLQKPDTYPGPGGNYATYQNQPLGGGVSSRPQQQPIKPQQPAKLKLPAGQFQPRRESDARSQGSDTQPKPKPPVAVKPRVLSTDLTEPGMSPSPWEREQKEREIKRLEEEARQLRQQEIQELEALGDRLSSQGRERLRRLRLDEEFDRRVREASKDDDDAGVDSDTDMGERASGRAKMLRMMQDDLERRQKQAEEEKLHKNVEDSQANVDIMERQERRLQRFETECEEQRVRQMKRQEKRAHATEDYLLKQRDMRERQRREMEEHQRQQRLEDERQRDKQREELRRKKELERSQLREMEERVMRDAARAREVDSMHQPPSSQSTGQPNRSEAELRHEFSQMKFASSTGPQYGAEGSGPGPQYRAEVPYSGQSTMPEPQYSGPRPQYRGQVSGPGPKYGAQVSGPRPQYASQASAPGPQYTGQMSAPGPQYTGQVSAPEPQYTGQMGAPQYGGQVSVPGPQYGGQVSGLGPQYGGQVSGPGPQYGGQVSSPGPQYGGQVSAPGPQYGGQVSASGPQYGGQMSAPGPQYGGQVNAPGPQYRGPGPQYTGQAPGLKLKGQDPTQRPASAVFSQPPEKHVPSPPERWSSYDLYKDASGSTYSGLPYEPVPAGIQQMAPPRSQSSSSVLRQPDQLGSGKKSVSFNDTLATEIHDYSRFDSTSSAETSNFSPGPQYTNSYPDSSSQYSQATPDKMQSQALDQRTPENMYSPHLLVPGPTPGVVGAQEVYRDPRDRIAASKALPSKQPGPERMSFRDKMKMFAHEAGENTPKEKAKISRAQHWIEVSGQ